MQSRDETDNTSGEGNIATRPDRALTVARRRGRLARAASVAVVA